MQIMPIKTHKITKKDKSIFEILDKYLPNLEEKSVVAVTSKIISITEGRIIPIKKADKDELVRKESELYIDKSENAYGMYLTISDGKLAPTAGIDESNGNGYYMLWPKEPFGTAHEIRKHLLEKFKLKNLGVVITDSTTTPLRWGTTGVSIGHAGINPLNDYIGKRDLFDYKMRVTKASIVDGLAAASVLAMGEGREQTPIAVIHGMPNVEFLETNPEDEKGKLRIEPDVDLYASLLKSAPWKKGKKSSI